MRSAPPRTAYTNDQYRIAFRLKQKEQNSPSIKQTAQRVESIRCNRPLTAAPNEKLPQRSQYTAYTARVC